MEHCSVHPRWTCIGLGSFQGKCENELFPRCKSSRSAQALQRRLEAKKTRAIDFHENDKINEPALRDLIRSAVAFNRKMPKK